MVHFRVTPNCTGPYHYYPTNWLVVGCLIEMNSAGVVRFRVTPIFTIGFILLTCCFNKNAQCEGEKRMVGTKKTTTVTQKTKKGTESSKEG